MAVFAYKNRGVEVGQLCKFYRNLNNQMFSIVPLEGQYRNRVVAHATSLAIYPDNDQSMIRISKASQMRARNKKQRNVHCFIVGRYEELEDNDHNMGHAVTYSPFENDSFVYRDNGEEWSGVAEVVYLVNGKCRVVKSRKFSCTFKDVQLHSTFYIKRHEHACDALEFQKTSVCLAHSLEFGDTIMCRDQPCWYYSY